jgi:hypothetical protein
MCLFPVGKAIVAKKDIVCYKTMRISMDVTQNPRTVNFRLRSGIMGYSYEIGKLYKKRWVGKQFENLKCVERQGFHSYVKAPLTNNSDKMSFDVIVKCVIPKGTMYHRDFRGERGSRAIRIVSIVDSVTGAEVYPVEMQTFRGFGYKKRAPYRAKGTTRRKLSAKQE